MSEPTHETAGGVWLRDGKVLLERRPADATVYPGCLDLPGGHLEAGEAALDALVREWREELGIEVLHAELVAEQHDTEAGRRYRHHTFRVHEVSGAVVAREAQALEWWTIVDALQSGELNSLVAEVLTDYGDDHRS